jgi:hypothetical protein
MDAGKARTAIRSACWSIAISLPGSAPRLRADKRDRDKEHLMLDIVMLALGFGFFAAGIGYAYTCERL